MDTLFYIYWAYLGHCGRCDKFLKLAGEKFSRDSFLKLLLFCFFTKEAGSVSHSSQEKKTFHRRLLFTALNSLRYQIAYYDSADVKISPLVFDAVIIN